MLTRDLMLKDVITTNGDSSVQDIIELLFKRHIGCIVIVNDMKECIGIFTERDVIRIVAQNISLDVTIEEVMTTNPFTINEEAPFEEARSILKTHKIRYLPVISANGKLSGLISIRYILSELCDM